MESEIETIYRQVAAGALSKAAALARLRELGGRGEKVDTRAATTTEEARPAARVVLRALDAAGAAERNGGAKKADGPRRLTPLAAIAGREEEAAGALDVQARGEGVYEIRRVAGRTGELTKRLAEVAQRAEAKVVLVSGAGEKWAREQIECELPVIAAVQGREELGGGAGWDFVMEQGGALALARDLARAPRECLVLLKRHLRRLAALPGLAARGAQEVANVCVDDAVAPEWSAAERVSLGVESVRAEVYPGGVFVATLRDEASRNAFSTELTRGIQAVFEHLRGNARYKVAVFTGYEQYFASGGTKEGLLSIQEGAVRYSDAPLYELALACEIPVIAAMQGHAIGAGWAFGLFCDYPVLAEESLYSSRFMRYGFTPGFGSTLIFPWRFGGGLGRELLFAARDYSGGDLKARGVALPVLARAEVLPAALALARRLAARGREALVEEKRARVARLREVLPEVIREELAMHDRTFVGNAATRERIERDFAAAANEKSVEVERTGENGAGERGDDGAALEKILGILRVALAEELQLEAAEIDADRPFTDLGLDSISGVTWVRRVNKRFGAAITANQVYHAPTLREFAQLLVNVGADRGSAEGVEEGDRPPLRKADRRWALSEGQKGLWMLHRLDPTMAAYNVPVAFRITAPRWLETLDAAVAALLRRHPVLRTVIATDESGQPYQAIGYAARIAVRREPASGGVEEARVRMGAAAKVPFKLEGDFLMRVQVFPVAGGEALLLVTLHHILFDGTSLLTFIRDFITLWTEAAHGGVDEEGATRLRSQPRAEAVTEETPEFFEFVEWERNFLQSEAAAKELAYWKRQLGGELPILDFPADRTRPAQQTFAGATVSGHLSAELSERIRARARERKVSLFTLLLAIYKVLLHRYTRQETLVVGVPVARRPEERFERAIGCFVNMVAAKSEVRGDVAFTELLEQVKQVVRDGLEHANYPFSKLVSELGIEPNPTHSPVFQTVFVLQNFLRHSGFEGDVGVGDGLELLAELHQEGEYDLRLEVVEEGRRLAVCVAYNPQLYSAETAARLIEHFGNLAEAIVAQPERSVGEFGCAGATERRRIEEEWNATARVYPKRGCVHERFEQRAAERPDAVAVVAGAETLTYREVERRSTLLARYLQRLGVGPERRVALCLQRAPEMVMAVLAVLKAGGAYVPLDPAYPAERVGFLLADCGATVVLADEASAGGVPAAGGAGGRVVLVDKDWARIEREAAELPELRREVGANNLAYVIYTSGSTGTPKGVMVEHGQILNTLDYLEESYPVGERDAYLLKTNYTFDVSLSELFGWFVGRGRVVVLPAGDERAPERIVEAIRRGGVTHVNFVPPALAAFLHVARREERFGTEGPLRCIMIAGEALPKALAAETARFFPRAKVENIYGPTETAIYATGYSCGSGEIESAQTPIGRPLPNTRIYILDARGRSTGIGVPGELAIAGVGVARGYLNRSELTAARFVADPLVPGARMFLTGDLARWLPDGTVEFLGRIDQQIKIRGFRVEPGEIEACLKRQRGVRDCVVLAVETGGSKQLVGYYVPEPGAALEARELTQQLAAKLPDYMVPALLVAIDAIPLTPSGKVDRRQLASRPLVRERTSESQQRPQTEAETIIAGIWKKLLNVEAVGTTERFFEVGGDSLLAVMLADQVSRELGCAFSAATVFKHPTIRAMAEAVSGAAVEPGAATRLRSQPRAETEATRMEVGAEEMPEYYKESLAIIGISCRFPGAEGLGDFWEMLREGREGGRILSKEELARRGVPEAVAGDRRFVPLEMSIAGKDEFDAEFFGLSGRHALFMDPQFRALLMHAWNAVEDAGYAPEAIRDASVFMSAGSSLYRAALEQVGAVEQSDGYASWVLAQGGTIPAMVSYCLGLTGPSLFVHTNCSSSLAALYLAQQTLRSGASKHALVGAATLFHAAQAGYLHRPGMNFSSDGKCRTFDAAADGMVGSEGAAVVLVKRASEAWADGDPVYAVVRGIAMNNDGAEKAGFYSPGVRGQAAVIEKVLQATGVDPETISYIEAHGTGTQLGDPVEVMALADAYRTRTRRTQFCGLGSVKTNIGHADTAAGLAGCIKLALSLRHRTIPASLHYERANPAIDFAGSPFYVVDRLRPWAEMETAPRRAALSSFGIGGTNVHAVFEEAQVRGRARAGASGTEGAGGAGAFIVVVSARNAERLKERVAQLRRWMERETEAELGDIAFTLWTGRAAMAARVAWVVRTREELLAKLAEVGEVAEGRRDELLSADEAEAMALKWRDEGRLDKVAQLWVRGFGVAWERIYPGREFRRVHLPAYPFAKDKYSLPSPQGETERERRSEAGAVASGPLHPLLHENVSTLQQVEFRSMLSGREFFLADHVVQGGKTLPGVAFLEMARAAVARGGGGTGVSPETEQAVELADVVWLRPFVVGGEARELRIGLTLRERGRVAFEIFSGSAADEARVVHCRGMAAVSVAAATEQVAATARWREIAAAGARVTGEECYAAFAAAGFEYGEGFRSVREVFAAKNEVVARLELSEAMAPTSAEYRLHPGMMDGALQAVVGAALAVRGESEGVGRGGAARPFAVDKVTVLRACPRVASVWIRPSDGTRAEDKVQRRDIDVCDEAGRVCVALRGYATARAEDSEMRERGAVMTFRPVWRTRELKPQTTTESGGERIVLCCGVPKLNVPGATVHALTPLADDAEAGAWFVERATWIFERVQQVLRGKSSGAVRMQLVLPADEGVSSLSAVVGLLRTARLENPKFFGQVVEVDGDEAKAEVVGRLQAEAAAAEGATHVRYVSGVRQVFDWEEVAASPRANFEWRRDGVYLITGGAGGIGVALAREILKRAGGARVVLVGRAERSGKELAARGLERGRVDYRVCDVACAEDVRALVEHVKARHGRLDGVLHAAGVVRDNFVVKKTSEEFRAVLAAKVRGTLLLERAARDLQAEWLVLFSSGVASFGNAGQCDYATANAFLDHFARARSGAAGAMKVVSINWPLWKDGGMRADGGAEAAASRAGLRPLETAEGIEMLERALGAGEAQRMVLCGEAEALRRLVAAPQTQVRERKEEKVASAAPGDTTELRARTRMWVREVIAEVVKFSPEKIGGDTPFEKLGLDSVLQVSVIEKLESGVGELAKTLLFEYSTLDEVVDYLVREHAEALGRRWAGVEGATAAKDAGQALPASATRSAARVGIETRDEVSEAEGNAIAIVGVSGRYPMANSLEELWENLKAGRNCIGKADRPEWRGSGDVFGGFIEGIDRFDHGLFGVPRDKVSGLSPESRLFLEVVWELFEDAGYSKAALKELQRRAGVGVGVFAATMYHQYAWSLPSREMAELGSNATEWHIPNRVSHAFDLTGPSLAVNAACSGSLLAIHLACESLQAGSCAMAVAGGVNLTLLPSKYPFLKAAGVLGSGDRSRSFGEGDGYIPGEGVGAVLLKPLARARGDGDRILGVIKGSFVNHTGGRQVYTAPDPTQQARLITEAMRRAGVDPRSIGYVESAVNGSPLGDPLEVVALKKAFAEVGQEKAFCALGSVKSNLGHLEAASGVSQVSKVLLQLRHRTLVPTLHTRPRNRAIKLENSPFYVQEETTPWARRVDPQTGREWPRRCLINSFGAGGTGVTLVVEEHVAPRELARSVAAGDGPALWVFSAQSEASLGEFLGRMEKFVAERPEVSVEEIAAALRRRNALAVRAALVVRSREEALRELARWRERGARDFAPERERNGAPVDAAEARLRAAAVRWTEGDDLEVEAEERAAVWCVDLPKYAFDHGHSLGVGVETDATDEDVVARVARGEMSEQEFERFIRAGA